MIKPQMMNELLIQMTAEAAKPDPKVSDADLALLKQTMTNVAKAASSGCQYIKATRNSLSEVLEAMEGLKQQQEALLRRLES
ncbi:hypothetical protein D5125_12925 [Magnetovirga frankeli]|uniref:hypothetical protein n=1 Tax=Magnetovirga frankeli TaxID=947516 RepID=UPI0012932218|nr:hypothetical protein D5125_12925 [gamma proteobacterium SS-5]